MKKLRQIDKMSAIWSSSERPMSVRMVWLDGVRHAILSQDDPLISTRMWRQRPQTSPMTKNNNYSLKLHKLTQTSSSPFKSCFMNLHLFAKKSDAGQACKALPSLCRRQSAPSCSRLYVSNLTGSSVLEDFKLIEEVEPSTIQLDLRIHDHVFAKRPFFSKLSNDVVIKFKTRQNPPSDMCRLNTLSERVLRWLDLSGRILNFGLDRTACQIILPQLLKPSRLSSGDTFTNHKNEASCKKIAVHAQCFVMQQVKVTKQCHRHQYTKFARNREDTRDRSARASYVDPPTMNRVPANSSKDTNQVVYRYVTPESLWAIPKKPQLHIYMPKFECSQIERLPKNHCSYK